MSNSTTSGIYTVTFAFALWLVLEGAIVQEAYRFLKAKAEAAPEHSDEITGGMNNIICSPICCSLLVIAGLAYCGITEIIGCGNRFWWLAIPAGFVVVFFAYCLSSVPIAYCVWFFKFRAAELASKDASK